ncbi:NRDE family protein [Pedobacter cryotolerans]|uniref:ATP-grasp domain-containing protein n=1 Tax=Pedobacter cryotolerans TaxID=2571270 RepID=A0A4U1CAN8_9SPHI|nr:NRDE family protein [Pedobacter cryotolerans]TKC02000.1 hypothetical protein FA045_07065 [Pedobacter cryotolerans]
MCTVSFLPTPNGIIITSNRDEDRNRNAIPPVLEKFDDLAIAYPKDPQSGGTWIAITNKGTVGVLLNGAFENHVKKTQYAYSRGLILLKILKENDPEKAFDELDLNNIENFTLVLYAAKNLISYVWDGETKHKEIKDPKSSHIWSSATLYPKNIRLEREKWFSHWLATSKNFRHSDVINFHKNTGKDDVANGLVMKRDNHLQTVSITSVQISATAISMRHENLINEDISVIKMPLKADHAERKYLKKWQINLKIASIKLRNWEYWPMHVVYAPMYIYWFYLSAKAKSLFFFSAANPSRKNAGFAMEKKSDTYQFLRQQYYPKTIVCQPDTKAPALKTNLEDQGINFPVIAKPEMGERGMGVKLLPNLISLIAYSKASLSDFLVQQYIDYPNEVGIFYHRMPNQKKGIVTGIVGKEFLSVIGDGKSTLADLILKSERHILQFEKLKSANANNLSEILPLRFEKILVPFGNHCRGAKFVDLSHQIDEQLTEVIDNLCQQIPDFYFGRLDIKFANWEKYKKGENFVVIELNGAASEPTHMYDPKHSIFFAWREIKKHWDILYKISKYNVVNNLTPMLSTSEGLKMLKAHQLHVKSLKDL